MWSCGRFWNFSKLVCSVECRKIHTSKSPAQRESGLNLKLPVKDREFQLSASPTCWWTRSAKWAGINGGAGLFGIYNRVNDWKFRLQLPNSRLMCCLLKTSTVCCRGQATASCWWLQFDTWVSGANPSAYSLIHCDKLRGEDVISFPYASASRGLRISQERICLWQTWGQW